MSRGYNMKVNVLICDDDPIVHEALGVYFDQYDFNYKSAMDGEEALRIFEEQSFDIVILDIMMPKISGTDVCLAIKEKSEIPIIMLTAKGEEVDRLLGFDLGADDYIVKPFSAREVIARIKAVLSRTRFTKEHNISDVVRYKQLEVNITRYSIIIDGVQAHATPKEVEVLFLLVSNPQIVFSREQIMDAIWGCEYSGDTRTIDTHIKRIRAKLPDSMQKCIQTIYGVGYKFEAMDE
jgi:DNA-binding response OmpR family regulator